MPTNGSSIALVSLTRPMIDCFERIFKEALSHRQGVKNMISRPDAIMKQTLVLGIGAILFMSLALNGCSTATPIISEWRNPAQASGSFQRLMIAGPSGDVSVRRTFEDEFVTQLAAMGIDAVPSYSYVPDSEAIKENSLKQAAQLARAAGFC